MKSSISLSRAVATAAAAAGSCLLACALQGAFACPAAAFTPSSKTGGENTPLNLGSTTGGAHATSGGGASIVRTIVGLAIVIAVIWGLAWILRQVKAGKEGGRDPDQSSEGLASVAALTLGSGRSVHLVRAGSDYVLLGSTEHGVAPIHRYTEEEAQEAGLLFEERPPERSRLLATASRLVAGPPMRTLKGIPQGAQAGDQQLLGPVVGARSDHSPAVGRRPDSSPAVGRRSDPTPAVGRRPDPMRMPSPSSSLIDRLRELTVRR
jgi:flagellar protein FliO/FliZ